MGCPDPSCDEEKHWCVVSNPGCDTDELRYYDDTYEDEEWQSWTYCDPGLTPVDDESDGI